MPQDDVKATEPATPATLSDGQIVTERKIPRRSFFIAAGALVAGSAALVACGNNAGQGRADPDQKRPDPDQQKAPARPDPDQKKPATDPQKP